MLKIRATETNLIIVPVILFFSICSGCPDAVKLLVGNKCDLPAEVDLQQAKVHARS